MSSGGHRHADRPTGATPQSLPAFDPTELGELWDVVHTLSGHDFELYEPGTTLRRLARRMRATGRTQLGELALRANVRRGGLPPPSRAAR